jgi:acetate---CoA ligase (ADP-forming)
MSMNAFPPSVDLERFLHPRSAAVIGVPGEPGRPGWSLFAKLRRKIEDEGGRIYPVNPRVAEIDGLRCYARITEVPEPLDLAVIMVGDALGALRECAAVHPQFAVIFTAGFAETGAAGAALQADLARVAAEAGIRLFGPNTNLNAFETFRPLPGKKIALITQSGHQGRPIVQGEEQGIAISHWIPTGNEVDLEVCDFIEYFCERDEVGAIAAYVEGFKSGARLRRAADRAAQRRKPIVLIKVGRSPEGARMALAHTGHLAGSDAVHQAFFDQYGIVRVRDLDELLETSALFARLPPPRGEGVAIYGISGGTAALLADLCGEAGLRLPPLAPATQERLRGFIPGYLTVSNPVDNGATPIQAGHGPQILDALLDDPETHLIACPITGALGSISDRLAHELIAAWKSGRKPMVAVWSSPKLDEEAYRVLVDGGIPLFRSLRNAVGALHAYFHHHRTVADWISPLAGTPCPAPDLDLPIHTGPLSEPESKALLQRAGIPVTAESVCHSPEEAVAAARRIGFPVAAKIASRTIPHKSEAGLVRLRLGDEESVHKSYRALLERAHRECPSAVIDGVLIQEMVEDGVEMLVGLSRDPVLGPVLAFGLGGTYVESLGDVALRTIPLRRSDIDAMIRQVRGFALLDGARGRPRGDLEALADALWRVAGLAAEERVAELDINPLMVLPRGRGVKAADALVVLRDGHFENSR